jgi:hypothetical protein
MVNLFDSFIFDETAHKHTHATSFIIPRLTDGQRLTCARAILVANTLARDINRFSSIVSRANAYS